MRDKRLMQTMCWLAVMVLAAMTVAQCSKEDPGKKEAKKAEAKKAKPGEGPSIKAPDDKQPGETTPADVPKPKPEDLAFPASETALDKVEALKYLPADTLMVVVAANPQGLLDRLGREQLTKKYAQYYEMGVAEVTQVVGQNILDPKNLPEIGVDPTAPAGFALLRMDRPVGVLFAKLSDADKFKTMLYSVAGKVREKLEPHVAGNAMAICPKDDEEICFVIKDGFLFFHFADLSDEEALAAALSFAALPAEPSIADDEKFKATMGNLKYGKDAAMFINVEAFTKGLAAAMNRSYGWTEDSIKYSNENLAKAKAEENAEEIKYWEQRVKEDKEWAEKMKTRKEAEQKMFSMMLNGLGNFAVGAELGERSVKLKAWGELAADSILYKVMKPGEGISVLVKSLKQRPFYLANGSIDVKSYMEIVELMMMSEGVSGKQMRDMFKAATQLDLDKDVLAPLTGEIGFAAYGDIAAALGNPEDALKAIDGCAVLGVADPAATMVLLDKLAAVPLLTDFVHKKDGQLEIPVPEWKTVYVSVAGNYLVASTDKEFAGIVAKGGGESFVDKLDNAEMKALMQMEDMSAIGMMDFGIIGYMLVGVGMRSYDEAMAKSAEVGGEEIPFSKAYKAKEKELEELRRQVKTKRDAIEKETNEAIMRMLGRIGTTVSVAKMDESSVVAYGGHYVDDDSVTSLIDHMIEDGLKLEQIDSTKRKEVWSLDDKKWELQRQLDEQRSKDIQEYHEKKYQQELDKAKGMMDEAKPVEGIANEPAPATAVAEPIK